MTRNETSNLLRVAFAAALAVSTSAAVAGGVVTENFDEVTPPALPSGWSSAVVTGLGSDTPWVSKAAGYSSSGANVLWVDDVNDYADIVLTTPPYTIAATGSPTVAFKQSYSLWAPDPSPLAGGVFNGAVFEISINGGAFQDFLAAGGTFAGNSTYNTLLDPSFDNPVGQTQTNRAVWGGTSSGFVTTTGTLPAAALGANVRFRWRLGAEGGGRGFDTYSGWWLDDFQCDCTPSNDEIFANGFD